MLHRKGSPKQAGVLEVGACELVCYAQGGHFWRVNVPGQDPEPEATRCVQERTQRLGAWAGLCTRRAAGAEMKEVTAWPLGLRVMAMTMSL